MRDPNGRGLRHGGTLEIPRSALCPPAQDQRESPPRVMLVALKGLPWTVSPECSPPFWTIALMESASTEVPKTVSSCCLGDLPRSP